MIIVSSKYQILASLFPLVLILFLEDWSYICTCCLSTFMFIFDVHSINTFTLMFAMYIYIYIYIYGVMVGLLLFGAGAYSHKVRSDQCIVSIRTSWTVLNTDVNGLHLVRNSLGSRIIRLRMRDERTDSFRPFGASSVLPRVGSGRVGDGGLAAVCMELRRSADCSLRVHLSAAQETGSTRRSMGVTWREMRSLYI